MIQLRVKVKQLNKRKVIPSFLPDPNNIVGVVNENFTFEGEEVTDVPNKALGKWYVDRDGYFYWEGGVTVNVINKANLSTPAIDKRKDWGFIDFKIDELWKLTKGEGIRVAILDSGLNFNLNDFKNKSDITYYNACIDSEKKEDCLDDSEGHGTDCAGILCAQGSTIFGVAPQISLMVIRITDENLQRKTSAILNGLKKAIASNVDIISLSFSIPDDINFGAIHETINEAFTKNITVVASAGDSGGLNFPIDEFPASFPECLSVGGITSNRIRSRKSTQSNFLDLMGPGEDLQSATNPSKLISGTSFSTPFIAGIIAILKSQARKEQRTISNTLLFDILKRTSDNSFPGYNIIEYGWGIIDALAAIKLLKQQT